MYQLLQSAEEARQLWAAASYLTSTIPMDETVYRDLSDVQKSLLTCTRPVSKETIMRMRKLQEFIDPTWKPVAPEQPAPQQTEDNNTKKTKGKKRKLDAE